METKMRVLFASTRLSGGAGIACRRIWESFRENKKVDIATLVYRDNADLWIRQYRKESDETLTKQVYEHGSQWADEKLSKHLNEERSDFSATYLSALELEGPYDNDLIGLFNDHDVVNMHWISGLFSVRCLQYLSDTGKPVVITMHDQKHVSGACHYSAGCRLFTVSCSGCPQLATERAKSLAEEQHRIKHAVLGSPNFYWTGPSEWIVKEAARSGIPYSTHNLLPSLKNPVVDDAVCKQSEYDALTAKFTSHNKKVALVADDLNDPRKGILLGVKALAMAVANTRHQSEGIELHLVGSTEGSESSICEVIEQYCNQDTGHSGITVISHGRVPSHHLAIILRLVDLLIFPSIEENYSNLLIETLGQGTSVVAAAVGGNREIARDYPELMSVVGDRLNVENGINGGDAARLSVLVKLLSKAIQKQLAQGASEASAISARERCRQAHSRDQVANAYMDAMQTIQGAHQQETRIVKNRLPRIESSQPELTINRRKANRRRTANTNEPVFWIGTKNDWPVVLADGETLFLLVLKPSWDNDFISKQVETAQWDWTEHPILSHDIHKIPELEYWDLVALVARPRYASNHNSKRLLLSSADPEHALPVLLQAAVNASGERDSACRTLGDLLWLCINGECIVTPMQGLKYYPKDTELSHEIDVKDFSQSRPYRQRPIESLSLIRTDRINLEEPVYWLGRNTFNDLTLSNEKLLIGCGLYPSWERGYVKRIFAPNVGLEILEEVPHTMFSLIELPYWNTVVFQISSDSTGFLFTEEAAEVHSFPVLCLGLDERSYLSSMVSIKNLSQAIDSMKLLVPPMAGFRQMVSSL